MISAVALFGKARLAVVAESTRGSNGETLVLTARTEVGVRPERSSEMESV